MEGSHARGGWGYQEHDGYGGRGDWREQADRESGLKANVGVAHGPGGSSRCAGRQRWRMHVHASTHAYAQPGKQLRTLEHLFLRSHAHDAIRRLAGRVLDGSGSGVARDWIRLLAG